MDRFKGDRSLDYSVNSLIDVDIFLKGFHGHYSRMSQTEINKMSLMALCYIGEVITRHFETIKWGTVTKDDNRNAIGLFDSDDPKIVANLGRWCSQRITGSEISLFTYLSEALGINCIMKSTVVN
jgi:hypothetical protein